MFFFSFQNIVAAHTKILTLSATSITCDKELLPPQSLEKNLPHPYLPSTSNTFSETSYLYTMYKIVLSAYMHSAVINSTIEYLWFPEGQVKLLETST